MRKLFGTSGIRGSAEDLFTNKFCFDLGRTFSIFLKKHNLLGSVAVGMDPRASSQRIKEFFISGLVHGGRVVYDEGITPVPSMAWLLKTSDLSGSAMITGSHIDADLNGIKFFAFGEEILKKHEGEIEEIYEEISGKENVQNLYEGVKKEDKAKTSYIKMLLEHASRPYPPWKVVVDCGNGAQSEVIPKILKDSGLDVTVFNCSLDKEFIARDTEVDGHFNALKEEVVKVGAKLGIGYDADGDRVVFFNKNGKYIPGDYSSSILAKYEETQRIAVTFNVSQIAESLGKEVSRTKVGSPFVVEKMKEIGAGFGFEANGGPIFGKSMLTRDGGMATVKMLNLMKLKQKGIDELVEELPKYYLFRDKVDCPWELDTKVIEKAREKFKGVKVEELDGLKFWPGNSSWILFRSSKNAPEFRVFAEAQTQEEAVKLGKDGIELVKDVIANG